MAPRKRLMFWTLGFLVFLPLYAIVSVFVIGMGFGLAEAGTDKSSPTMIGLTIVAIILAPVLILADYCTPPLPDAATLSVGVVGSALIWWIIFYFVIAFFRHRTRNDPDYYS